MNAKYWIVMGLVAMMALPSMPTSAGPIIVKSPHKPPPYTAAEKTALEAERIAAVAKGGNDFALNLYAELARRDKGNLFFSPSSIHTALAMTYAGARGNTEKQMFKTLMFPYETTWYPGSGGDRGVDAVGVTQPWSQERVHSAFAKLIKQLNTKGKKSRYQLSVANALWGQKGYPWRKEFLESTRANYDAGLRKVDFVKATEDARKTINVWVAEQTRQKIKDLLQKGDVDRLTVLVLTNAIYFKGDWASKFKAERTKDTPFRFPAAKTPPKPKPPGPKPIILPEDAKRKFLTPKTPRRLPPPVLLRRLRTVSVPMMNQKAKFAYMETRDFQALELPYAGDELSMIVFLPRRVDGLKEFEKSLKAKNLSKWMGTLRKQEVIVSLPKFKTTCRFKLKPVLKSMGMTDAFSSKAADFSGMATMEKIWISDVIHKAFVDVNEEGTEAAAATAVIMARGGMSGPTVFRADHPFVFMIRHRATGSILFLGRVVNPKGKTES